MPLRRDQERIADARDPLAPIYAGSPSDEPDLIEAKVLLDELGAALGWSPAAEMRTTART